MSETDSANDETTGISIKREQSFLQKETVKITSNRGEGTRDQDKIAKTIEREAEIDVGDDTNLPDLVTKEELVAEVNDVQEVMEALRDYDPDA
jgi:hypothetical protein